MSRRAIRDKKISQDVDVYFRSDQTVRDSHSFVGHESIELRS